MAQGPPKEPTPIWKQSEERMRAMLEEAQQVKSAPEVDVEKILLVLISIEERAVRMMMELRPLAPMAVNLADAIVIARHIRTRIGIAADPAINA